MGRLAVSRPADPEPRVRSLDVLGSGVRRAILEVLSSGEKTITELAQSLHANPTTLRYHLGLLIREGLAEEIRPTTRGTRGRPALRYRAARHAFLPTFPARHFDVLALAAMQTLVDSVGEPEAVRRLRAKGEEIGRALTGAAAAQANIERWSPDAFERAILRNVFPEYGVSTEVLARGPRSLAFRSFTCPFLELAEQMPGLVCDALDVGFHEGIDRTVGSRTERIACMGHGDGFCEYRLTWRRDVPPRRRSHARGKEGRADGEG